MSILLFLVFFATCVVAGSTGAFFAPGTWYQQLRKPPWTPPGWVFSTVWTALYVVMSIAATRVAMSGDNQLALALWALQIALNTLWSPVFFGLHRIRSGMAIIGLVWLAVAMTLVAFFEVDRIAGLMMVPYLAWVTLASCLNYSILRLNPR